MRQDEYRASQQVVRHKLYVEPSTEYCYPTGAWPGRWPADTDRAEFLRLSSSLIISKPVIPADPGPTPASVGPMPDSKSKAELSTFIETIGNTDPFPHMGASAPCWPLTPRLPAVFL